MRAPEFWKDHGPLARLLTPVGQAGFVIGRLRRRLTRPFRAAVPVICVGNLTAGGAGKTPTVIKLARKLEDWGYRPHILTRGYGGRTNDHQLVDLTRHDAWSVGDEALLLARLAPTWIGRDRVRSAKAATAAGAGILIMDDGFQNPRIHQDIAIIVIDGPAGAGNNRLLPAGPLREPVEVGLARAWAALRIGPDATGLDSRLPHDIVTAEGILEPQGDIGWLKDAQVIAFAGIGRPGKFFATLKACGARLIQCHEFADHHPYSLPEIKMLLAEANRLQAVCITTEKDQVRVPAAVRDRIAVLPVAIKLKDEARFDILLRAKLASLTS